MDDVMDDVIVPIAVSIILGLTVLCVLHLVGDYRRFAVLIEQCEKYGYIQDETVRLVCTKEKRP